MSAKRQYHRKKRKTEKGKCAGSEAGSSRMAPQSALQYLLQGKKRLFGGDGVVRLGRVGVGARAGVAILHIQGQHQRSARGSCEVNGVRIDNAENANEV